MKKLLKYLKPYRKECVIAPAFKMLEALFELFVPLVIKRIIDEGIKKGNKDVIWQSAVILVSLGIIGLVCALIAQYFSAKAAIGFATGVRNSLYDKILGFSYENVVGHLKFLLVYMLSGIGGGVVSCAYYELTHQAVVSAGASGAVYGLVAMVIYLMYTARKRSGMKPLMYRMAIVLLFLVYSNFGAGRGIDIAAHLGGLVFGFIVSILFLPYGKKKKKTG